MVTRRQAKRRTPSAFWANLRQAAIPAAAMVIVTFFGGYALFGANGALAWGDYSKRLQAHRATFARLEVERARLANRVALLDPAHADRDIADEYTRRQLGVVGKDELIIRLH